VFSEHVLVVVHHDVFAVVGHAVPLAGAHDPVFVAAGGLQPGAEDLVPAVLDGDVGQIRQQAVLRQEA